MPVQQRHLILGGDSGNNGNTEEDSEVQIFFLKDDPSWPPPELHTQGSLASHIVTPLGHTVTSVCRTVTQPTRRAMCASACLGRASPILSRSVGTPREERIQQ